MWVLGEDHINYSCWNPPNIDRCEPSLSFSRTTTTKASQTSSHRHSYARTLGLSLSSAPSAAATPPVRVPAVCHDCPRRGRGGPRAPPSHHRPLGSRRWPCEADDYDQRFETPYEPLNEKPSAAAASDGCSTSASSTAPWGFCARCRSSPPSSASLRQGRVHGQRRPGARAGLWMNAAATASSRPPGSTRTSLPPSDHFH